MPEPCQQARLYRGQDYAKLLAKCRAEGQLFVDPEFPADNKSLGFDKNVEWKRPTELVDDPKFMLDANRFSVVQGELGDCWFLSALSAITMNPGLLMRVIPKDQDFTRKYIGIFHFRFWQTGEWLDVVVDDRLPVIYGDQLCFSQSSNPSEFWSALLEKAYAKLNGSYGRLEAGKCYEATEDLTGGVTERFQFQTKEELPRHLFNMILKAKQRGSLVTCSVPGKVEKEEETGLVAGHGYCITGAKRVKINAPWKPHVDLLRLRNPWGDATEWRGSWSDESEEWRLVPDDEKTRLKLIAEDDGEFWITFADFKENFAEVTMTSLNPQSLNKEALACMGDLSDVVNHVLHHPENLKTPQVKKRKVWEVVTYDGSWVRNSTAGGAPNNIKLFSNNPQYALSINEADEEALEPGTSTVMVSLTQKHRRIQNLPHLPIAVVIYKIGEKSKAPCPLTATWLRMNAPMLLKTFIGTRTVTYRLHLKPGKYILIPCTSKPDMEGEYLLRVFCEKAVDMEENDEAPAILSNIDDVTDGSTLPNSNGVNEQNATKSDGLRKIFSAKAGDDTKINSIKLQRILTEVFPDIEFSIDLSRSLLALMDRDFSGSVDYYELENLVDSIRKWKKIYENRKDKDTKLLSGRSWGIGDALKDLGYQLPRRLQGLVVVRYGDEEGNISSRDFLMVASRFSVMLERYNNRSEYGAAAKASLDLAEWLQDTLYC